MRAMRPHWRASLLDSHPQRHNCAQNGPGCPKWMVGAVSIPGVDLCRAASYPRAPVGVWPAAAIPTPGAIAPRRNPLQPLRRVGWSPREPRRSAAPFGRKRSGGGHQT
ncbi:hypothetical protein PBI_VALIDUS_103 [Mycobacterium phage Validus]|uniref:Uncharacterized protein n=1 Tax=Mycobacterium phage Validus TaxID=1414747 RepID=V5UQY7_9CAUD|nr:hypothetical protein CC50_gp008 [Mycobacterium phage Validus]AHB79633.1 hypothetical protein PBI_VALIDUS_103 [Mycobacterium phage Validus]